MNSSDLNMPGAGTVFGSAWSEFEMALGAVLPTLIRATSGDVLRLTYPSRTESVPREVTIEPALRGTSDIGFGAQRAHLAGAAIHFPDQPTLFCEPDEAARELCTFLRDIAHVPHPTLLTADVTGTGGVFLPLLGVPGAGQVAHETSRLTPHSAEVLWPVSLQETGEAVEDVVRRKFGSVVIDDDGDFIVESGGACFMLTLLTDRPLVAFRAAVVLNVYSRRAAAVEVNYLNREHLGIRWVLRGYTLFQELGHPTAPFVPTRFAEALDEFAGAYEDTVGALQLRLGGEM